MKTLHQLAGLLAAVAIAPCALTADGQDAAPNPPQPLDQQPPANPRPYKRGPNAMRDLSLDQPMVKALFDKLKEEDPDEFARLQNLYATNRPEFLKQFRELLRQRQGAKPGRNRPQSPEELKCQELARLYHQTEDEAEKARLKTELEAAVRAAFETRVDEAKERLERLEDQMAKFREHIEKLEASRERIVETRVDELTRPPELNWNAKW